MFGPAGAYVLFATDNFPVFAGTKGFHFSKLLWKGHFIFLSLSLIGDSRVEKSSLFLGVGCILGALAMAFTSKLLRELILRSRELRRRQDLGQWHLRSTTDVLSNPSASARQCLYTMVPFNDTVLLGS